MIKQKNGFLLAEETLKMILAVIAITFLIYFLVSFYFGRLNAIEFEKAKRNLIDSPESLKKTIDVLKEKETRDFVLDSPDGWLFLSFTSAIKPNSCAGKNCICICDKSIIRSQAEVCDKPNEGICSVVENLKKGDASIEIKTSLTKISISKINNEIIILKQQALK